MLTANSAGPAAAAQLWHDLASGAESGWDFSSRWFANGMNLTTIRTTHTIPADLNAFLYQASDASPPALLLYSYCHSAAEFLSCKASCTCVHRQSARLSYIQLISPSIWLWSDGEQHCRLCRRAGLRRRGGPFLAACGRQARLCPQLQYWH